MTDRQKVKHAIEVLKILDTRLCKDGCPVADGIRSTLSLLEKKHVTDGQAAKSKASPKARLLSGLLLSLICARKRNFRQPDLDKWSVDMDKILRLDGRSPEHLTNVIEWCQQDSFWQNNILSPSKLRKQLDRLEMQMERDHAWKRKQSLKRRSGPTPKSQYMEKLNETNQGVNE